MKKPAFFSLETFDDFEAAFRFAESFGTGWMFRGQSCSNWPLSTSIERAANSFALDLKKLREIEKDFLLKFERNIHLHDVSMARTNSLLDLLALMQHHGAPTRLLDWTFSFPVAAYFAFEDACADHGCAIWALKYHWCNEKSRALLGKPSWKDLPVHRPELFKSLFVRKKETPLVYQVTPFLTNKRLTIQQGTFLWPGDISKSFESNVSALPEASEHVVKIVIPGKAPTRIAALRSLYRMNMYRASLFPGLDGFSSSFRTELPFPWRRR